MRLLIAAVVMCALALSATAQARPYFDLGVHDDGAIVFNRGHQQQVMLERANELGATWVRTIVYRDRVKGGNFRAYRRAIRAAGHRHLHVQAVIACNGQVWNTLDWELYVRRVVRQLGRQVHRWSICNEPNQPGWLTAMPGLDLAASYRLLYQTGYRVLKTVQPNSQVLFGELSSNYYPLEFLRRVLCSDSDLQGPNCVQLKADCLAYHPYQQDNPEAPGNLPFTVGIGSLNLVVEERNKLFGNGLLTTPDGAQPPPLCLTEFGYQSRGKGHLEERNLPDEVRKQRWGTVLGIACQSPAVQQLIIYQLAPNPLSRKTRWDSSIMSRSGHPDKTYFGIRRWRAAHPECMR